MTTATAPQLLTHSRLSCFRACPRRHYLRFELGLVPEVEGLALRVGSGFHAALDAAEKGLDVSAALEAAIADPYDLALVAAMFNGHRERWATEPLTPVASELAFDLPVVNPETGAASPLFRMAGVIDQIVQLPDGRLALKEDKTTSRDFSPGADYWVALHKDQQLSIYVIAARSLGFDVTTVLYDVTKRPGQRPLKATPEDKRKYLKGTTTLYANQRATDETPEEYAKRVAEAIAAAPETHFARIEIARLDADLDKCRQGVWQQMQTLRAMQRSGPHAFYENPAACFSAVGSCDYLPICDRSDLAASTPAGFVRSTDLHPELARSAATDAG